MSNYVAYVSAASEAPLDFHFWSGLTAISATLRRRVWVSRGTYNLFPNLYTVLVGSPGIGKGSAINPVLGILKEAGTANMLSDRVTIEYVLESMANGWSGVTPGVAKGSVSVAIDHSALLVSRELSVFITASQATLPILTDLWDSVEGDYSYGTRHKGNYKINSPCLALIGGSTQEWLISSIPSSAIGGGFTRRVNFVVGFDREKLIYWPAARNKTLLYDNLVLDMKDMGSLNGEFRFDPKVVPTFEKVYRESEPDVYDDEATSAYKSSKWAQVCKVAMCLSAARGDDLIINKDDFEKGYDLVNSVAKNIPLVFRGVGKSDLAAASAKVLNFIELKGYAAKGEILRALWSDVQIDDLDRILMTFLEGGVVNTIKQGMKTMYFVVERHFPVKGGLP